MGMEMKTMERRRKRSHLSRRGEDVQQEKPRKLQVRTKKIFLQQSPKVRAEDGLLARRPKKRSKSRMRGAKMTLIQKLLQRRRRRLLQRRRSLEEREGRKGEGGHQDQRLPRRKSRAQSTTSMTSPTPHSSRRKAPTIPGTRTTDR